jgi:putative inorganic carbon (hco3(-)) transporter
LKITFTHLPKLILYAIILLSPLAKASVQGWAKASIILLTILAIGIFTIENLWKGKGQWLKTCLDWPIIALVVISLLSFLLSLNQITSLHALSLLMSYIALFYLTVHVATSRIQLRVIVYVILAISGFIATFGLMKHSGHNPFPWWDYKDVHAHSIFLSSTFGNKNHFAGYMEMSILLITGFAISQREFFNRFALLAIVLIMVSSLILASSKAGWICITVGFVYMVLLMLKENILSKKKIALIFISGFIFVCLIALSSRSITVLIQSTYTKNTDLLEGRMKVWRGVMNMIVDYPITGVGPGNFATIYTQYYPPGFSNRHYRAHNDYLEFISEIGIPLFIIIIWMIINLYRTGIRKLKNSSKLVRGTTLGALCGISAMLVHSFVDFNLQIPANALLFTILVALVMAPEPKLDCPT